jgi:hypothetical protein
MINTIFKKALLSTTAILSVGFLQNTLAHEAGGPIDFTGTNANATDLATVQCFDDGNGPAHHLSISIQDLSPPVTGLLVSMQVYKDNKMTNTTDTVSGDSNSSEEAMLIAGSGEYRISVTKSNAGTRQINATYHCETSGGVHTGTSELTVFQVQ